jgi:hypothetical protein
MFGITAQENCIVQLPTSHPFRTDGPIADTAGRRMTVPRSARLKASLE